MKPLFFFNEALLLVANELLSSVNLRTELTPTAGEKLYNLSRLVWKVSFAKVEEEEVVFLFRRHWPLKWSRRSFFLL